ncbi:MAG: MobF family relaxase [Acidimicrobiales bacterium]
MLSIARLGRSRERYYLDKVARGAEDYYTGAGEAPGHWAGGGAATLGLDAKVAEDDLSAVLGGRNPRTDEPLVPGAGTARRRVGFDLTFSAPKGVSLAGLLGPPEMSRAVSEAHAGAVADALGYLEDTAAFARRGSGGTTALATSGFVAAAFVHRSSRGADPQLHTHVLVANLVQAPDGRWSALDAQRLYAQARTAGFIYQATLRARLTRSLGLGWGPVKAGMAEPAGFATSQLRAFSTRRIQVEADLAAHGNQSAAAAQVAAHRTRAPKDRTITPESLRAAWARRAAEVGIDTETLTALCQHPRQAGLGASKAQVIVELLGPSGLTAQDSSFDRRSLLRAIAASSPDGICLAELYQVADELLADPEVVALPAAPDRATGGARWSTAELLAIEAAILAQAEAATHAGLAQVSGEALASVLDARPSLSSEQAAMVRHLTTSGAGIEVVVGRAGTGKTFALEAARAAWSQVGLAVIGTALSARAAAELGAATAMPTGTLARLLGDLERPGPEARLAPGTVVVVDEAAMVGTRELARLLAAAERDRAKVVLVGDPRQLPEIQAGGALAAIAARQGAITLTENRR